MTTGNPVEQIQELIDKDRKAIDLFLKENQNRGATINDWFCASDGLRENYRKAVLA